MLHYLFGFSGRINRARIWLYILIMLAVYAVMFAVAAYGLTWTGFWDAFKEQMQAHRGQVNWFALPWPNPSTPLAWGTIGVLGVFYFLLFWAGLAVTFKRLHDRNKSAWWLLLYWGVPMAVSLGQMCPSFKMLILKYPHNMAVAWGVLGLGLVVLALDIWVFIDLYCLRGTKGENKYGPDPLA